MSKGRERTGLCFSFCCTPLPLAMHVCVRVCVCVCVCVWSSFFVSFT